MSESDQTPPPPPGGASTAPLPPAWAGADGANQQPSAPPPASPLAEPPSPVDEAPGDRAVGSALPPDMPEPRIIQTDAGATDGLVKCPSCGATEIALNIGTVKLRCGYCRHEWLPERAGDAFGINDDIGLLSETIIGSGFTDIVASAEVVCTFKCSGCGADVVIDTASSTQARCHWCRNKLSMSEQIPNGAVPDMVLPFSLAKDEAVERISSFVKKRMYFAHPKFKEEFNPDNVMGVYLPYVIVDVNAHSSLTGRGERETRRYTRGSGDDAETLYDADVYRVGRDFDLHINDLTVESSTERLNRGLHNTNNVINSIMPFDVENSLRYDANFLAGFTSERRDTNMDELNPMVTSQSKDIARFSANETITSYDRGVRWDNEVMTMKGQRWISAYLPVWLYSYHQDNGKGRGMLHYVAVNGRTGETMGSVPLHQPKLLKIAALVELVGIILAILIVAVAG